jgi:hypothetical protein
MTKRTNTIYKQNRQYNDQNDKQQSTNRTDNAMTKRTNTNLQTGQTMIVVCSFGQCIICSSVCRLVFVLLASVLSVLFVDFPGPFGYCIVCPVCRLLFLLLVIVLSVLFVDCCLSFWSLYCLSCL